MKDVRKQRFGSKNGHYKHGLGKPRLFRIWSNMKNRCYNPNVRSYERYGGKGITICPEWLDSFECFYKWAVGHGYSDDLTLDRIENDKGYSPDNCRWATFKTQRQNSSNLHLVTHCGVTLPLDEWSRRVGINPKTVRDRLKRGWSYERALTVPVNRR